MTNAFTEFQSLLSSFNKLKKSLPTAVSLASKNSRIVEVFTNKPVPSNPIECWEVFDSRLNALYGEDLRDPKSGRLPNVERGKHGLDLVSSYIHNMVKANTITWDAALPKMQRLVNELESVKYVFIQISSTQIRT